MPDKIAKKGDRTMGKTERLLLRPLDEIVAEDVTAPLLCENTIQYAILKKGGRHELDQCF